MKLMKKNNLDIRINHLFGSIGKESGGTFHNLYGFDQSQDIRIGAHYGITDRLMTGFSRSKRQENLELLLKFKLLEQTTNQKVPIGITLYGNTTYSTKRWYTYWKGCSPINLFRTNYFYQKIFSQIFSWCCRRFSAQKLCSLQWRKRCNECQWRFQVEIYPECIIHCRLFTHIWSGYKKMWCVWWAGGIEIETADTFFQSCLQTPPVFSKMTSW